MSPLGGGDGASQGEEDFDLSVRPGSRGPAYTGPTLVGLRASLQGVWDLACAIPLWSKEMPDQLD